MPLPLAGIAASVLAPIAARAGAKVLDKILRDKVGDGPADVIQAVAGQLGAPASPEGILGAYEANPDNVIHAFRAVEADPAFDWAAVLEAETELQTVLNVRYEREQRSKSLLTRIWRPLNGVALMFEFLLSVMALCYVMVYGDAAKISAMLPIMGPLVGVLTAHAGVVGVYVYQRSGEKKAGLL